MPLPSRTSLHTPRPKPPARTPGPGPAHPRGWQGPRAGAGALGGGSGRGPEWVGAAFRPRATRAPPPGPAAATSPNFFFPGKLSRAVPGVGVGGGASKFPLLTGKIRVPPPRPSPPRRRGAPPTTGAGRSQGGTATGSGTRAPKPIPRPGAPREGPPRPAPGQLAVLSKQN